MPKSAKLRLTVKAIDAVKPAPGETLQFAFADPKGLRLVVYPSGRKSFCVRYSTLNGVRGWVTLGDFGETLTPERARKMAETVKNRVAEGGDPAGERAEDRAEGTFEEWKATFLERAKGKKKTWKRDEQYLALAEDLFGKKKISDVSARDCDIFFEQTRERRGNTSANRALASLKKCLGDAWRLGHIEDNPARRVKPMREPAPRTRVFSAMEWLRLLVGIQRLEDNHAKAGMALMFSTGCRLSEALDLKWADVDLKGCIIRLPNPKSQKPQSIPLPAPICEFLKALPRRRSSWELGQKAVFVVAGRYPDKPRVDLKNAWAFVTATARVKGNIHDVRRTVASNLAKQYGLEVAQHILRHSSSNVTWRHYVHAEDKSLKDALEGVTTGNSMGKVLAFTGKALAS